MGEQNFFYVFEPLERAAQLRSFLRMMINECDSPLTSPASGRLRPQLTGQHISSSVPAAPVAVITKS